MPDVEVEVGFVLGGSGCFGSAVGCDVEVVDDEDDDVDVIGVVCDVCGSSVTRFSIIKSYMLVASFSTAVFMSLMI